MADRVSVNAPHLAEWLPLLWDRLTPTRVKAWLGHLVRGEVERFHLPGIAAINDGTSNTMLLTEDAGRPEFWIGKGHGPDETGGRSSRRCVLLGSKRPTGALPRAGDGTGVTWAHDGSLRSP